MYYINVSFCTSLLLLLIFLNKSGARNAREIYGTRIASFRNETNDIQGILYAIDEHTIFIKNFTFTTNGINAFFKVDKQSDIKDSVIIHYPKNCQLKCPLQTQKNKDILLRLPVGYGLRDITLFGIGEMDNYLTNILISKKINIPISKVIGKFSSNGFNLKSGNVTILDERTISISQLWYDGTCPESHFLVGNGSKITETGIKVRDEDGELEKLKKYENNDIIIRLPMLVNVYEIDWLAMWCVTIKKSIGVVVLSHDLNVPPDTKQYATVSKMNSSHFNDSKDDPKNDSKTHNVENSVSIIYSTSYVVLLSIVFCVIPWEP